MNTKKILIEYIDPAEASGVNNQHIKTLQSHFKKLKVVARGNQLMLTGNADEIALFEEKFEQMTKHITRYGGISTLQLESILAGDHHAEDESKKIKGVTHESDVLVYGNHGKVIRAKTPNQRKMVSLMNTNDILFAIVPLEPGKPIRLLH